ncbi:hypothetical protein [Pseudomonas fluorescens]|uniref:Uncharacterized protein n=1 Tax=Pseudomonas fluorescens TaxID=294 RepID=A0A5E7EH86_PSEFL|nr:hypothetical protein [Pseudomonas fluorescens]VVO26069.1 hypothetical protein PS691_04564 [Pseudomonas fluorescens]
MSDEKALQAWYELLDDTGYRTDSPDAYHNALLRLAEELLKNDVINASGWMELKTLADAAYSQALEEAISTRLDDPEA